MVASKHKFDPRMPYPIEGPYNEVRERLAGNGMSDMERAWRKQWLKDQALSEREPVFIPEWHRETRNPLRRFYTGVWDTIYSPVRATIKDEMTNKFLRYLMPRAVSFIAFTYATWYYFKYHPRNWESRSGWTIFVSRDPVYPGDPDFPFVNKKTDQDYYNLGFKDRNIERD